MRCALIALLSLSVLAQTPREVSFNEDFFNGDRRAILQACADKARSIKPKEAKWLAEYGRAYLAALDRPKAEIAFKEAEAKESKDGEVLRLIAQAWLKHGYKAEALDAFEKILKRDPKNKEAIAQAGVDLAEVGLVNEADRYMNAFVALEKEDWERFLRFGKAFLVSGHRKKAAPWFAKAVSIKPKEEKVFLEISKAFAETQALL
jgi:tetratricopeptide (TPR) repeat protein